MARANLTDITVRQLPHPDSGDVKYWDTSVPGFGVRVTARSKSWFVVRGEKRQLTTIGKYPEKSLRDARTEAKRLLVQGPTERRSMRLLDAVETYLADCENRLRPGTLDQYARPLRKAPDIALKDYKRAHLDVTDPHYITAFKVFFNWCVKEGLIDRNPISHLRVSYGQRSRVLTDDEIKKIWAYEHRPYSDIIKLCILTGQRVGEVSSFNPAWVSDDTITVPSTIAKNGREHTVPFNLLTAQYLKRYLGNTFAGFSKAKSRMDQKTGITGYTVHDLRRTFSTTHAMLGTPIHVTEKLLNHVSGSISGVSAIYNRHHYLKEMRQAVLLYETHIATLVDAKAQPEAS